MSSNPIGPIRDDTPSKPAVPPFDLNLGDVVEVTPDFKYYGEWRGDLLVVIGLKLGVNGDVDVTVADGLSKAPHGWDQPTDGFRPEELRLVRRAGERG